MHPEIDVQNIDVDFPTFAERVEEIAKGQGMWTNRSTGMTEGVAVGPADSTDQSGTRSHIMPKANTKATGQVTVVNPHQSEHSASARQKIAGDALTPILEEYNEKYGSSVTFSM